MSPAMRRILIVLCVLFLALPLWAGRGRSSSHSRSYSSGSKSVRAGGYTTRRDTYVSSYRRSSPGAAQRSRSYSYRAPRSTYRTPRTYRAPRPRTSPSYSRRRPSTTHHRNPSPYHSTTKRDPAQRDAFQRFHPCPSTGKRSGACPGYVVDHIRPLAKGGADHPSNMQWRIVEAAKAKDKWERK